MDKSEFKWRKNEVNSKSGSVSKYDSNTGNIWIRHSSPYDIICEKVQKERNDAERRKDVALKALKKVLHVKKKKPKIHLIQQCHISSL